MRSQNRQVTWTTLELTGLLEDEECRVHFTRTIKHLALHPYHLNNVQRGLNQILRSSLNSYDKELKGFVLAFRNPKLLNNLGEMLYDSPFIHIDIEADFYLFRPTIGSSLKGIVKKKGLDHIVVLVHKIYTVSIPKPDDIDEWVGELEIGQEVKCCVTQIDNRSKPPFICATLRSDYLQGCKLPESINNIDDDSVSEKERKKHRKKQKKSRENNPNFHFVCCKVENESESSDNLGNDISGIVKSENIRHSMQDTILNTDDSLNNLEVDNIPKKHKKSKKTSKSLLSDDKILDEHTELRKAVKRENSIPLDSVTETETKKRKKHAKKSREIDSDSENEEKVINNTISRIKSEEEQHTQKHIISNADLLSSNLEDSVSKKHKKNKKASRKMSSSESEDHVKIKIEKQDSFIDRITNESQISRSENQIVQNLNESLEMSKFVKKEVSIEYDSFEKERKKKYAITSRDSLSKSVKIKNEDDIINDDVNDTSNKERKKSSKKRANVSTDSDFEIRIKSENITNDVNDIPRAIKHEPEESQYMKYNISAIDSSLSNSDLDCIPKKPKKKKTIDSEYLIKIKTEKV